MAGRGSRFTDAGYVVPKPLIPVHGSVPMIRLVIENLRPSQAHRFIFLCQADHVRAYDLESKLTMWAGKDSVIVTVDEVTQGAACTVLLARDLIDSNEPLMIANSDQYVDVSMDDYFATLDKLGLDGLIMTMTADDPKWSFVRSSEAGEVIEVVEKVVVSDEATVGIYNFRRGADFVAAAEAMIEKGLRVNGEFYVAPSYNQFIQQGARVACYNVGSESEGMYGLGTPADLRMFESLPISSRALDDLE